MPLWLTCIFFSVELGWISMEIEELEGVFICIYLFTIRDLNLILLIAEENLNIKCCVIKTYVTCSVSVYISPKPPQYIVFLFRKAMSEPWKSCSLSMDQLCFHTDKQFSPISQRLLHRMNMPSCCLKLGKNTLVFLT